MTWLLGFKYDRLVDIGDVYLNVVVMMFYSVVMF